MVGAAARREAARYLQQSYQVSERRAGQLLSLSSSSLRYRARRPAAEDLRQRLRELAAERPRYGYQRLWVLLRREGWQVNHKRVYRPLPRRRAEVAQAQTACTRPGRACTHVVASQG